MRFNIGDKVKWKGGPNEFRDNRHGNIVKIKGDHAFIDDIRYNNRLRLVPLKILELDK